MYFVILDTVHLFQNYSVDECETEEEAFKKLDEAKRLHGWRGWVAKEVDRKAVQPVVLYNDKEQVPSL